MAETLQKMSADELVKPISKDNPVGDDPEMNPDYIKLDAELAKMSGIDYNVVSELSQNVLTQEAKHLRVAFWLTLAWVNLEGLSGFRDGLAVVHQLFDEYGTDLYPDREKMQIKSLGVLNTEKRISSYLQKAELTEDTASALQESQELISKISTLAEKHFGETAPGFDDLLHVINDKLGGTASVGEESSQTEKDAEETREQEETSSESANVEDGQEETGEQPEETDQDQTEPEETPISISEDVAELLEPISGDNPTGNDVEKTDDQEVMVEYMGLESEMGKFSGNNYEKCVSMCRKMLLERTKHLRIAIWLLIAWSRTEKLQGFKKGFQLLYQLLSQFGTDVHPQKESNQTNTLQMLTSETRIKLIEKIEVDKENAQTFVDIQKIFDDLNALVHETYGENEPRLSSLATMLSEKAKEAASLLKPQEKKEDAKPKTATRTPASNQPSASQSSSQSSSNASTSSGPVNARDIEFARERDADLALKKSIEFYFEEPAGEEPKRKVPTEPHIYGLSRLYRWGNLKAPPSKDDITQIDPPNEPKQNFIKKLVSGKEYAKLIPEIEVKFLNRADFLYWLDAQRYVVESLEAYNDETVDAAFEIKVQLARLIQRLPNLPQLMYKDKKTPFANSKTQKWLEEEVQAAFGSGGQTKEKILPPIMGEDYQEINEQYEKVCEELPENFEQNLKLMQGSISGDMRPKGRFLRLLNTANYCYTAKQYSIARVLFQELLEKIDKYNIIEWERALCVSVWQSMFLNNAKLREDDLSEKMKTEIENQQELLYERIAKYDSVLALTLINRTQGKGE